MYQIKSIGRITSCGEQSIIAVDKDYRKALKHLKEFSHIHVFYLENLCGVCSVKRSVVEITDINEAQGHIETATISKAVQTQLIDIKPYFPSEDTIQMQVHAVKEQDELIRADPVNEREKAEDYEVDTIGEIRNVNGKQYIQLRDDISMTASYITIFWWFHKFDSKKYRAITECTSPYENAPRTGIFATRSPVRPNPIAMTVVRALKVDQEHGRIYINNIESFDRTPCIGINAYDSDRHCVHKCRIPQWLAHWPKQMDQSLQNNHQSTLQLKDSGL